jgi:glyoxylase-like metal-dependent hydrolase (beta-lactamase superfamily II)
MLEDDFTWILRKVLKGLALSPGEAASRAGLPEREVLAFAGGEFSVAAARALAPVLGLDADAFARHPEYLPAPLAGPAVERLDLPYSDGGVNAWLVRSAGACVLFDAGQGPADCARALDALAAPAPDALFITHGHPDHLGGIDALARRGIPAYGPGIPGVRPVAADDAIPVGGLEIRAVDLSGHATPMLGYHVGGLARPVLVVGDALFAGSVGGCPDPAAYRHALSRLKQALAPLPDDTLLLPGHGPATTLGEERRANPFIAAFR